MKLTIGLSAALASFAAAAQQAAQVYILPTSADFASSKTVPPSIARLIFLQRLDTNGKSPSFRDVPDNADSEEFVSLINTYGKQPLKLFAEKTTSSPSQLVVMLEGMTEAQIKDLGGTFDMQPAFTIPNPPSSAAHDKLVKNDFYNAGITNEHSCSLEQVINMQKNCWSGDATVAKYDVSKDSKVLKTLNDNISKLSKFAKIGEMETTLVLLPSSKSTSSERWSDKSQELRRRQAEAVISADDNTEHEAPTSVASSVPAFFTSTGAIPSCFDSEDSCVTGTGNCSSRGVCLNKYAKADGSAGKDACYTCHCLSTLTGRGGVVHWAGAACSKEDISVQFWLFAGFTIVMVGVLSLGIGMLFNVGEEKLPGVIGAGVSRSK